MVAGTLKEYRDRWQAVNVILEEERKRLTQVDSPSCLSLFRQRVNHALDIIQGIHVI